MTQTALVVAMALLAGCAWNRPLYTETSTTTNGTVTVKRLSVATIAIWPATTSLEKQRVSIGKTMSVGTTALSEDSGSTNIAVTLEALTKLLQTLK